VNYVYVHPLEFTKHQKNYGCANFVHGRMTYFLLTTWSGCKMRGGSVHQCTGIATRHCETVVWRCINNRTV